MRESAGVSVTPHIAMSSASPSKTREAESTLRIEMPPIRSFLITASIFMRPTPPWAGDEPGKMMNAH